MRYYKWYNNIRKVKYMRKNKSGKEIGIGRKVLSIVAITIITITYLSVFKDIKAASTATATLTSDATNSSGQTIIGAGETFTIKVNAQSNDGINMFYGLLSYDTDKL